MTELLTANEVGRLLKLKPARIYALTREQKLPHIVIGERQYRYSEKSINEWIENGGNQELRSNERAAAA